MSEFAQRLREQFTPTKLSFTKFGCKRAVKEESRKAMAAAVDADPDNVSAAKKLLDTTHPAYKDVTRIFSQCRAYWKTITVPFPQDGVRLVKLEVLSQFNDDMARFRQQLDQASAALDEVYYSIRKTARHDLADLFDESDYPMSLSGAFEINWEYPSIDPPEYLRDVNQHIWNEQREIANARMTEAVQMAEQAFAAEFGKLLGKIVERLTPNELGESKRFEDVTVENLKGFFDKFNFLSVGSNDDLERLVKQAQDILDGKDADTLRSDGYVREVVKRDLAAVSQQLDALLVDTPKRSIILEDD
jgi:hypothetical protein